MCKHFVSAISINFSLIAINEETFKYNMFKQLQERQMQQQFQELGDASQQLNYVDQQSMMNKQVLRPQFPSFSNLTPIQDSTHMFPDQGFSNALAAISSYGTSVPSDRNLDALDPLEQKILFNTDDNNCLGDADNLGDFSSLQSGSWSALMQSAVAETTSSDTGLQEEWSGLSYQNPDTANITQLLNVVDSVNKKHTSCAGDNSNSSCFSGLHQSGMQISFKQKDGFHTEMSHKSFRQSPENSSNWMDCSVSSFIDPNVTGRTSQHMLDQVHKANTPTLSSTSSGTSILSSTRSQLQRQHESGPPIPRQSPQEALAAKGSRFSEFTPASSLNCTNPLDQQLPFLGLNSEDQRSLTYGLSYTMSPPDAWTNVPSKKNSSGMKPLVKLEAFGCSLEPSHFSPQNYSLMNQINLVKNEKTDLSSVSGKISGVDFDSNNQQHPGQAPSQKDGSQCNFTNDNVVLNRTEQSKIDLQMATTWFNHYGTLKNDDGCPMHEPKASMNTTQQFFVGKPHINLNSSMMQVKSFDVSHVNCSQTTSNDSIALIDQVAPHICPKVTEPKLGVLRPNKRKIDSVVFLPWHKAVIQGSQRLQNVSTAELEWTKSVNQLAEKVDHEEQIVEAIHRPKKRIIFTTQLIQKLFHPAPSVILFGDATKNCVSAAYFAARLALADACSLTSNCATPCVSNVFFQKHNFPRRNNNHDISKSAEDIINRSKRLEEELLSLDDRVAISGIWVESQELEKFSVINRLAKFHGRGPRGATDKSISSSPKVNTRRMSLYVRARPMPKTVPEGANCSLLSNSIGQHYYSPFI